MKHVKAFLGILLSLVMVFALAMPAAAEGETGSITINDAVVGQTYTIYQILDLESYNASANAYAYKATTAWNTFINSDAIKGTYVEVDAQGYVTWKDGADAAAFAKAAQKYAKDNSIANQGSVTATTTTVTKETSGVSANLAVSVSQIVLDYASVTIKKGKTKTLTAVVSPTSATNKKLKWTSSSKKYATVSSSGVVKAKKAGKTIKITAQAKDGSKKKVVCRVKIIR